MFTLKLIKKKNGDLFPNTKHAHGGTDLMQRWAFEHLMHAGYSFCPAEWSEFIFEMAASHDWGIEISREE